MRTPLPYAFRADGARASVDVRGHSWLLASDAEEALAQLDRISRRTGVDWFETACRQGILAGLGSSEAAGQAENAVELLRKALGPERRDIETYGTEWAFDPLRERDDFQRWMNDLASPLDPTAK